MEAIRTGRINLADIPPSSKGPKQKYNFARMEQQGDFMEFPAGSAKEANLIRAAFWHWAKKHKFQPITRRGEGTITVYRGEDK